MKITKKVLALIATLYLVINILVIVLQRKFIYLNSTLPSTIPDSTVADLVTIPTEDNLNLTGWWISHPTNPRGIALVYCHGNGATLPLLAHVAKMFQDYGLNALLYDYRSYGASDVGELTEDALARDARAAYDFVKNSKHFPDKKIIVWGHSLGAAVAARLATERTPAGLIAEGAFSSIFDMARYRYPGLILHPSFMFDAFPVTQYLAQRQMPLLMLHAEKDSIIPLALGKRGFTAAHNPKEFVLLRDIDHNDFPSVEAAYRGKILEFMAAATRD